MTGRGTIRCSKLLLATNGYTAGLLPEFEERIVPALGQILVTQP
jgi:glycine/D-amino acid oxidase-like deaminating enzyme